MKTLWKSHKKNTGNLDTINGSATNESKEAPSRGTAQHGAKNWNDWYWVWVAHLPVERE